MPTISEETIWKSTHCARCPELVKWNDARKVVKATPCPVGGLLAVGEAPGSTENEQGRGFVGKAGTTLRELLKEHELRDESFGCANVCRCQPEKNRKPKATEIGACVPFLTSLIRERRPKVILAVGGRTAVKLLCGRAPLYHLIEAGQASQVWSANPDRAYSDLCEALAYGPHVIPMPHTSPLAMNRYTPGGVRWSEIARDQVAKAVKLLYSK